MVFIENTTFVPEKNGRNFMFELIYCGANCSTGEGAFFKNKYSPQASSSD